MKNLPLLASLATVLAFTPLSAGAQTFQPDPCGVATFPDEAKGDEYRRLLTKLSYGPRHNAALREREELGRTFLARQVGNELFSLWNDANRQIQEAVHAPELEEAQVVLMDHCLDRLRQSPGSETNVVRAEVEYFRALLALSDAEMAARWKARLKAMLDAFGTPVAANQTLRIKLGLPVAH